MGEQRRQNTNTYCEKSRKKLKKLNEKLKIENWKYIYTLYFIKYKDISKNNHKQNKNNVDVWNL